MAPGDLTQGRRRPPGDKLLHSDPGDYGCWADGVWWCRTPSGLGGNLSGHEVTEHDDGTITVSPSILVSRGSDQWHGFLEHGVWREV